ncbi:hypothetical protein EJ08DRAFT_651847 [Tothia fuscella]|uniref:Beta/gamma crystallin 'Greek key' domain-containing protein n=1 Tax=Tothia fuscella TaxID=1048955 RepID=A0A9P4NLD7_9PEZI|nr:hypothetical protein EJ08DRAFT_651847 [Tothia fuscella]
MKLTNMLFTAVLALTSSLVAATPQGRDTSGIIPTDIFMYREDYNGTTTANSTRKRHLDERDVADLGGRIDLCHNFNFQDCELNRLFDHHRCYYLDEGWRGAQGLSSLKFAGHMYCLTATDDVCGTSNNWEARFWDYPVGDMRPWGWDNKARSFWCTRID